MKAAVVSSFGVPPSFQDFRAPEAGNGEAVVTVHAAALSPIVKGLASGRHYASGASAGFVPGVDGVGIDGTGRRVYFLFPKAPFGSMAEKSLVASHMMVPVPENLSSERAAAVAAEPRGATSKSLISIPFPPLWREGGGAVLLSRGGQFYCRSTTRSSADASGPLTAVSPLLAAPCRCSRIARQAYVPGPLGVRMGSTERIRSGRRRAR
ncbi:uncharacterized protein SOCE26_002390 [Sorangium cellulosum]|uniref:Uncharacterized protein n=1 Tax=Sorangium cellulosum TaxID=56 RepID=A0A2L0EHU2_SORCE|nr:hypothetical protein [Sorangium cellulosum]AUX38859.1 uncharacterized protein SOCE26_002390 [Sorangium cellulosum]